MKRFEDLVAEAVAADVDGWGFDWLDGRATEERPSWGYAKLLAKRLNTVDSALDIDTGGGEVLDEARSFPSTMIATEGWPANAAKARELLGPRGVEIVATAEAGLPFADASFDLVSSRHPVSPDWPEIARVLAPGGLYFAQHVGPASAFELIEFFLGPQPEARLGRSPESETKGAAEAGLRVENLQRARCRMEFFAIGAVIWILRKCVWWVPDFSIEKYEPKLRELDARMRSGEPFDAHSTRHLIEARKAN